MWLALLIIFSTFCRKICVCYEYTLARCLFGNLTGFLEGKWQKIMGLLMNNKEMSHMPHYGNVFSRLRENSGDGWESYTRHEFVEKLSDGSLPRVAFLHYLRQDYVFLTHFSRAWALAAVKSEHYDELIAASSMVHTLVSEEMQLHVRTCQAAGISSDDLAATPERTENLAYTRYVLESGYSGDLLDLLTTLAPCVMGYGEIGDRLMKESKSSIYGEWINTYGGADYQNAAKSIGELLDGAFERRLGPSFYKAPRWHSLCARFRKAVELEIVFWQMGMTP